MADRARVAHVIASRGLHGGAEQTLLGIVEAARARGSRHIVLIPLAAAGSHRLADALSCPVRLLHADRLVQLPRVAAWLARQLRALGPAVVHAHLYHATVLTALTPVGSARRLTTHHHGDQMRMRGQWARYLAEEALLARYDHVVAVSEAVRDMLARRHRPPAEVSVIHNGWAGSPASSTGTADQPTVLCVAAFRPEKDHPTLLRAARRLREQVPGLQVLLAGPGEAGRLRRLADDLGLGQTVRFLGDVDDVFGLHEQAHAFVLPSRFETAGIAAMEAMASGLPLVATRVGGLAEIIDHERTGLLVPPGDPDRLARALRRVLTDGELARGLGSRARQAARGLHMSVTTGAYIDLYTRLGDGS